jgi:hypothetical protein
MTTGAIAFWLGSWAFVLGLTGWAFYRVLKAQAGRGSSPPPD